MFNFNIAYLQDIVYVFAFLLFIFFILLIFALFAIISIKNALNRYVDLEFKKYMENKSNEKDTIGSQSRSDRP